MIPVLGLMFYLFLVFKPLFLDVGDVIVIFTGFESLIVFLTFPFVFLIAYLIQKYFIGVVTRIFWRYTERKSPTKDGIMPRNIQSKTLDYYHYRSFMIKYGKNAFMKGIFPWLTNWFFNYVGASVIEKGATFEETVSSDRNVYVKRNVYMGVNSALAAHLVEGIFGNIIYFKVTVGDNSTLGGFNTIAPGCEIRDNSYLLPMAAATKYNTTKGNNYYYGMPLRRIFKKKIMGYLKITEEDLQRAEDLRIKQEKEKIERIKKEESKKKRKKKV
jgi:acetyltransferase-like isoleucine patch superfamily enzyme